MSVDLRITRTVEYPAGVAFDADSAVLADATSSYGVKRLDTGAVVVPAGTPMTRDGVGLYSYTIQDAAPGVTYLYAWTITLTLEGQQQTFQGIGEVAAPFAGGGVSYLTVAEADAIAAGMTPSLVRAYTAATPSAKQSALELATGDLDSAYRWQGRRYDADQVLEFPRVPYPGEVWDPRDGAAVVPSAVQRAVVLQAADRLDGKRLARLERRAGLASQTTGALSESYVVAPGSAEAELRLCPEARAMVARYRLRTGGLL